MTRVDVRQHNLPREISSFVGRERERDEVAALLRSSRLLTLVGPGGAGKTRLAMEAAAKAVGDFSEGVWLIELGPLGESGLVPQAVAQVLGVREQGGVTLTDRLCERLDRSRVLLALDNCEHLVDACAQLSERLLRTCDGVHILATSREPLGVSGEVLWRVPPLGLPADEEHTPEADAVRLFVERAIASVPSFALTSANRVAVVDICRRLDGLPLAIELAAARVRLLAPEEIAARLDDRFKLLTGGLRTAPARQQTLEGAVRWSYELLSPAEQRLFEEVSVFVDGFSLAAAEAVGRAAGIDNVLDLLGRLVDRSLVVVEPQRSNRETRYRLLETLRAFASQRLIERGEAESARRRLADWLIETAERAEAAFHGPDQGAWLRWAEAEHGNVRVVLQWLFERQATESALRLVTSLWWSWIQRGRQHESQIALEHCLALPGASADRRLWGRLMVIAGMFGVIGGLVGSGHDAKLARGRFEEALRIGLEVDDAWVYLNARAGLHGIIDMRSESDLDRLRAVTQEMLGETRRVGNAWAENRALVSLATVALKKSDEIAARAALEEGISVARHAGDGWSLAMTLVPLGDLERSTGHHARAGRHYEEALACFAGIGLADDPLEHPYLLHNLGYVALAEGRTAEAHRRFVDAITGYQRVGDSRGVAEAVIGVGATAAAQGTSATAVSLFAAAETALAALGAKLWFANEPDYARWRGVAAAAIDETKFRVAWAAGIALSIDDAIALAQTSEPSGAPIRTVKPRPADVLTPRERDVARLVAAGLSNRQIGDALVITEKTAANHVQRVLDKLGVHSRTALAARAAVLGLDE
jgi:predicted ATPase/DNA-binding CsgD family transcriptional regulator